MKKLKIIIILVLALGITSCSTMNKTVTNRPDFNKWNYEVENMGVGNDGTYLIKVSDYFNSTDESVYMEKLKRDAVHSVVYQGVPAGNGCIRQPALMTNDSKIEGCETFLEEFFVPKGKSISFVGSVSNGSKEIIRLKKTNNYKISIVLSVNKDDLRKYLINNNVIKPLDNIF